MSKPSINKSSRVFSNLLQQNCFVRDVVRAVDLKSGGSSDSHYLSLDEVVDDEGVKLVKQPVPYPITPDFVQSFGDSTDYRRDPAGAISNGVSKPNLGDCTDFQKIMSLDSASQEALYKQLQAKFSKPISTSVSSSVSDNKPISDGGDNNG